MSLLGLGASLGMNAAQKAGEKALNKGIGGLLGKGDGALGKLGGIFESKVHAQTMTSYLKNAEKGLFYHVNKDVEAFTQIYNSDKKDDPFKVLNDATLTGFKMFFHFAAKAGLLASESYPNSALAYLKRIGHQHRYEVLQQFIIHLSKLNSYCPWLFQELEGLQEAYINPFSNVQKEIVIDVKTLETIDGKMTALFQMYRFIVWDDLRDVWVLPVNLRRFSMSIYVYDYRMFSSSSKTAIDLLQTVNNTDIRNLNHTLFELGLCEFTNDSGKDYYEKVSNNNNEFATSNMNIKAQQLSMSSLFKTIAGAAGASDLLTIKPFIYASQGSVPGTGDSKMDAGKPSWLNKIKDRVLSSSLIKQFEGQYKLLTDPKTWKKELNNLLDKGIEFGVQKLENKIGRLYLGNVNGFGFDDVLSLGVKGLGASGAYTGVGPTSIFSDIMNSTVSMEKRTKSRKLNSSLQVHKNLDIEENDPSEQFK